jgi:hypothetical protein
MCLSVEGRPNAGMASSIGRRGSQFLDFRGRLTAIP